MGPGAGGGGVGAAGDDGEVSGRADLVEVEAVVAEGLECDLGVEGVVVAEAGLEGGPAAVGVPDDRVDREPGLVLVVPQLGAGAFEIDAEVVDDHGGEDRGQLAGIIGEPSAS